jgi:hypothetical protein
MKQVWIANHCDGSGPHTGQEVRSYPLGGGANLILCRNCFAHENRYRCDRGNETKNPENWPINWQNSEVYARECPPSDCTE